MIRQRVQIAVERVAGWSARHPVRVLMVFAILLPLAVVTLSRVHIAGTVAAMLGRRNDSAGAHDRADTSYRAGDELLVLVELHGGEAADDAGRARLLAFAESLEEAIAASSQVSSVVRSVSYRSSPDMPRFAREVILPAAPYYLDDPGFEEFMRRLEAPAMRQQIARNEAMASAGGPASAVLDPMLRDPLRLAELLPSRYAAFAAVPGGPTEREPPTPLFSTDGRALLIRVLGAGAPGDLDAAATLVDTIQVLTDRAEPRGLRVALGGGPAIAATTSRTIRSDAILTTLVSVGLLMAVFLVAYRRVGAPLIIATVAAAGITLGMATWALFATEMAPLSAVIAGMLAGLGVDYGVHFLSAYRTEQANGATSQLASAGAARHLGLPIITNCFTSIFGFISLMPSQVQMLRDFALMGALGLLGCLVAVFTLMPALLALVDRRPHAAQAGLLVGRLTDPIVSNPRFSLSASLGVLVLAVLGVVTSGGLPKLEDDLTVIHPRPNPALAATREITVRFFSSGDSIPIEVCAQSHEAMMRAVHSAAAALESPAGADAGVVSVLGAHLLIPDPASVKARQARLEALDGPRIGADLDRALAESIFDPDAFTAYRQWLLTAIKPDGAPDVRAVLAYPTVAAQVFPSAGKDAASSSALPTCSIMLVSLAHPLEKRQDRADTVAALRRLLASTPGVTLLGLSVVASDLEQATRNELPRSIAISVALVLAWLLLVFGKPLDAALALIPLVFAAACVIGFAAWFQQRINPINAIALPLLDGIAVDAGVFLVASARQMGTRPKFARALRSTGHAILVAAVTTITGFGSLMLAHTPAVQSLGLLAVVGVTGALYGALLLLTPLLFLALPPAETP